MAMAMPFQHINTPPTTATKACWILGPPARTNHAVKKCLMSHQLTKNDLLFLSIPAISTKLNEESPTSSWGEVSLGSPVEEVTGGDSTGFLKPGSSSRKNLALVETSLSKMAELGATKLSFSNKLRGVYPQIGFPPNKAAATTNMPSTFGLRRKPLRRTCSSSCA